MEGVPLNVYGPESAEMVLVLSDLVTSMASAPIALAVVTVAPPVVVMPVAVNDPVESEVRPEMLDAVPPRETVDEPMVTLLFWSLALVTAPAAMVAAKLPVPLPVTSPVRLIVWSPVLVPLEVPEWAPLIEEVPVTESVGVDEPERVIPLTVVGVIAPSVSVIAGVAEAFATEPLTPFAETTEMVVTVPPELGGVAHVPSARR